MDPSLLPSHPRQSLRERCGISLTIRPTSYRTWNQMCFCHCTLFEPAKVDPVQRRQEDGLEADEEAYDHDEAYQIPPPSPTPSLEDENHLLEVKEGLYIAVADDQDNIASLRTFDHKMFTHIIQVHFATSTENELPLPFTAQMQHLYITCPISSLRRRSNRMAVNRLQLCAARDFLSLALPHGSSKWWPEKQRRVEKVGDWRRSRPTQDEEDTSADAQFVMLAPGGPDEFENEQDEPDLQDDMEINVLVVAPTSRAVDTVSILFCYLAFLEGAPAESLTLERSHDPLWAEVALGRRAIRRVNRMARAM